MYMQGYERLGNSATTEAIEAVGVGRLLIIVLLVTGSAAGG